MKQEKIEKASITIHTFNELESQKQYEGTFDVDKTKQGFRFVEHRRRRWKGNPLVWRTPHFSLRKSKEKGVYSGRYTFTVANRKELEKKIREEAQQMVARAFEYETIQQQRSEEGGNV